MASGNKIIYRNDFNPGETDYGEPGTCFIGYANNQKFYHNVLGMPEEWNKNGSLCDRAFEAKKGLSIDILVNVVGVEGAPGAWPDALVGVVVDADQMPDIYNDTSLSCQIAANSFVHGFAGTATGLTLTGSPVTSGISLGQFYKSAIKVLNDGKAQVSFNGQVVGVSAESVLGKFLRPYRSIFTAGGQMVVDSLVVRA